MRVLSSVMIIAAVMAGPGRAQQPLTDVRVVEATWIQDVAITRWENAKYLELMKRQGRENWPKIKQIMATH